MINANIVMRHAVYKLFDDVDFARLKSSTQLRDVRYL
jgi:hypothetical protein